MKKSLKETVNKKYNNLWIIIAINVVIFSISNLIFDIKYEQVDDFIIYNLYSGLDGTYNIHSIYIHPILCIILILFFKIIPVVNWHSVLLLSMQFICFTVLGYLLLEKYKNKITILLYTIFASICYTSLLLLIQYTSVSGLLILTAFFMTIYKIEENKGGKKYKFLCLFLYIVGIMLRIQSLLIVVPFFILYLVYYLIKWINKKISLSQLIELIKKYFVLAIITIIVYLSNSIFYNTDNIYKHYMEYNNIRTVLQDLSYTDYNENKEIFDEIGWSRNDFYLFYTFNFGDENVYSKENLQKIIDYKINKNEYLNLNLNIKQVITTFMDEIININTYISILFITVFIISLVNNKEKRVINILIFLTTIAIHVLFIVLNRSMLRVVIPEYILGIVLIIYNLKLENKPNLEKNSNHEGIIIFIIMILIIFSGSIYNFNYKLDDYKNYQLVISYANEHKENVYLYTVPSLQHRYLAYSPYEMPPKGAFSNLRVMGGWDMFTGNYYDFKQRYNLEGTFKDLLKENVYLIDGDVTWSGNRYNNYINHIILFIKEHYNIDAEYEKVKEFDNIYIYKITNK